jgi:DNA-binding transcriptional ArsR family regulator
VEPGHQDQGERDLGDVEAEDADDVGGRQRAHPGRGPVVPVLGGSGGRTRVQADRPRRRRRDETGDTGDGRQRPQRLGATRQARGGDERARAQPGVAQGASGGERGVGGWPRLIADAAWTDVAVRLATGLRLKNELLRRQGVEAALASVSGAVTPAPDGDCIVVDKLQDKATAARGAGVTFVPSVFGSPHPAVVHAPGRRPVVQYPVAEPDPSEPVPLETVTLRPEALGHPVRRRLLRTLARGPHTTRELAHARELTPPEVSRHLAVLRRAGLLTSRRQGRYVRYTLSLPGLTALGADLPAAVLR